MKKVGWTLEVKKRSNKCISMRLQTEFLIGWSNKLLIDESFPLIYGAWSRGEKESDLVPTIFVGKFDQ